MGILATINQYYLANSAFLWGSLANYFGMLIVPFAMMVGVGIVYAISDRDGRNTVKGTYSAISLIVELFTLICLVKFIIAFSSCVISYLYRIF